MVSKMTRMGWLYDFYGPLLTERQRELLELYYHHDLSLGEIAEQYAVSRQAVYDTLRRTERLLEDYESRLGLMAKFLRRRRQLERLAALLAEETQGTGDCRLQEARDLVRIMLSGEQE
ncbi:hypothetical protein SY88_06730 [Clostridiales bacterium PH28_bin88]|nr:hypothetical protein SY88_06730 [Clostridiales bacterium PH28_bin88]